MRLQLGLLVCFWAATARHKSHIFLDPSGTFNERGLYYIRATRWRHNQDTLVRRIREPIRENVSAAHLRYFSRIKDKWVKR